MEYQRARLEVAKVNKILNFFSHNTQLLLGAKKLANKKLQDARRELHQRTIDLEDAKGKLEKAEQALYLMVIPCDGRGCVVFYCETFYYSYLIERSPR